ncbi:MAG: hypothetical protein AAGK04_05690 [Planctomycetota bacterium]
MFRITAVLGLCACASAAVAQLNEVDVNGQSLARFELVQGTPAPGEVVTVDLILDASEYTGAFDAWHFFEFGITITSEDGPVTPAVVLASDDQPDATAATDTTGDGTEDFGPFAGATWTTGRRPGAFPFAGASNGGFQFGNEATAISSIVGGVQLGLPAAGGRQNFPGPPEGNQFIHRGRVLSAFRMQLLIPDFEGELTIAALDTNDLDGPQIDGGLSVYPNFDAPAIEIDILQNHTIPSLTIAIPAPMTLAIFAALPTLRRRR